MNDKLIAEAHGLLGVMLADIEEDGCFECSKPEYDTIKALVDALEAAEKQIPRWIPCEERMPDICGYKCLICAVNMFGQKEVFTAFTGYMERGKLEFHSCESTIELSAWKITHWMPLPKGAEEEKQ